MNECKDFIFPGGKLSTGKETLVMGILNVTPDSFSDGGEYIDLEEAVEHAFRMAEEGASVIDVGGESSRPGAEPVSEHEELKRVIPVISRIREKGIDIPVSIDTCKPEVASEAVDAGAVIINDISGFRNPEMTEVAARTEAGIVIMHMLGEPRTMQNNPEYSDVVGDIKVYLEQQAAEAVKGGVSPESIMIDPGIGFGKTVNDNLELLRRIEDFKDSGFPILVGASRKSFIGKSLDLPVQKRLPADIAVSTLCAAAGVTVVRVHDVFECVIACRLTHAVRNGTDIA